MSHSAHSGRSDPPARDEIDLSSKDAYELVCRVVEKQTGGPDDDAPAGIKGSSLYILLVDYGDLTHEQADRARRAAIENGDILKWTGPEGRDRYTRHSEEGLRDLIAEEADRDNPKQSRIGKCNELLAELEADDE